MLPIGAQSSLTGGATPMGELILATSQLTRVVDETPTSITVEAGVTVAALQEHLATRGAWFPPAPTFTGACAGGIVATNAAGAATFKYGSTRDWVDGLEVVLADGTVLDLMRGSQRARNGGFEIETRSGACAVPVPRYTMPAVAKRSAGYHAAPDMDLVDLFIGSEGTLGVVTQVTFRVLSPAPQTALALDAVLLRGAGARARRRAARRVAGDMAERRPGGIDAAAIENMDRRSIAIVREDGADARHHVALPRTRRLALLVRSRYRPDRRR